MTKAEQHTSRNPYEKKISIWEQRLRLISKEISGYQSPNLLSSLMYLTLTRDEVNQKFENWDEELSKVKSGLQKIIDNFEHINENQELIERYNKRIFDLKTKTNYLTKILKEKHPETFFENFFND